MKRLFILAAASFSLFCAAAQNCPTITVQGPSASLSAGEELTFVATVKGTNDAVTYNWVISAGSIISGQGTSVIKLNTEGLGGMYVTATVELGGVPRNCNITASASIDILMAPEKLVSGNYTTAQALTTSVQNFIKQADMKNMDVNAFVYVYSGPSTTTAQLKQIKETIKNVFEKNQVFDFQYKIADGGKKKAASFEIYKLLPGSKEPDPSH